MEDKRIHKSLRKSVFLRLKSFCVFAGEHDFVEVVEWTNNEGFYISFESKTCGRMDITWGEWMALKKAVKELENYDKTGKKKTTKGS